MGDALPFVSVGTGQLASAVAAGSGHTCAILSGGVKCWGCVAVLEHVPLTIAGTMHGGRFNDSGQLGQGNNQTLGDEQGEMGDALPFVKLGTGLKASTLATGTYFTCALLTNGRIKCWGCATVLRRALTG